MPHSKVKTRAIGGRRRTMCFPCGKIVQGHPQRLKGITSAHQKVCAECATKDLSDGWKQEFWAGNLNDLRAGNSGGTNGVQPTHRYSAKCCETGDIVTLRGPRVGGTIDTMESMKEFVSANPPIRPTSAPPSAKKKKGKKKKNKKSKVQSDWADPTHPTPDRYNPLTEVVIAGAAEIKVPDEVDEDFHRVLRSITSDLSMDEILEKFSELDGVSIVSDFGFETAKDSIIGL